MRRHAAQQNLATYADIDLETYKGGDLPYEDIRCIYCGDCTYGYDGSERWPIDHTEFAKVHEENAQWMMGEGITNHESHLQLRGYASSRKSSLYICPACGWWVAVDRAILPAIGSQFWLVDLVCSSALLELDLTDVEQPLSEVRRYLLRRYESRHSVNPRVYEETVGSVFKDLGYRAEVTAYSNDGGVDVVLFGTNNEKIGVQVKRQQRAVEVEQIRGFLGALTLRGYARGVFVSTSKFRRGAIGAAAQSSMKHIPIELVDADRFFDMLKVAQLNGNPDPDTCGFYEAAKPEFVTYGHCSLSSL